MTRSKTGGSPYWIGDAVCDVCMRDVALPQTRSDEPLDSGVCSPEVAGGTG